MSQYVVKVIEFNGQLCIPIPKEIREDLGITEGTKVSVDISPDGKSVIIKKI